jgi:hypothetical protein
MISKEYLHERFTYLNGELYWKQVFSRRLVVGQLAGDTDGTGYRRVMMGKQHYKMHRLIWIMFHGEIPDGLVVDHIDQNRANNRIENLRLATKSENNRNRSVDGITFDKSRNLWKAQTSINNKNVLLGRYKTEQEAKEAYQNFKSFVFERSTTNDCT